MRDKVYPVKDVTRNLSGVSKNRNLEISTTMSMDLIERYYRDKRLRTVGTSQSSPSGIGTSQ